MAAAGAPAGPFDWTTLAAANAANTVTVADVALLDAMATAVPVDPVLATIGPAIANIPAPALARLSPAIIDAIPRPSAQALHALGHGNIGGLAWRALLVLFPPPPPRMVPAGGWTVPVAAGLTLLQYQALTGADLQDPSLTAPVAAALGPDLQHIPVATANEFPPGVAINLTPVTANAMWQGARANLRPAAQVGIAKVLTGEAVTIANNVGLLIRRSDVVITAAHTEAHRIEGAARIARADAQPYIQAPQPAAIVPNAGTIPDCASNVVHFTVNVEGAVAVVDQNLADIQRLLGAFNGHLQALVQADNDVQREFATATAAGGYVANVPAGAAETGAAVAAVGHLGVSTAARAALLNDSGFDAPVGAAAPTRTAGIADANNSDWLAVSVVNRQFVADDEGIAALMYVTKMRRLRSQEIVTTDLPRAIQGTVDANGIAQHYQGLITALPPPPPGNAKATQALAASTHALNSQTAAQALAAQAATADAAIIAALGRIDADIATFDAITGAGANPVAVGMQGALATAAQAVQPHVDAAKLEFAKIEIIPPPGAPPFPYLQTARTYWLDTEHAAGAVIQLYVELLGLQSTTNWDKAKTDRDASGKLLGDIQTQQAAAQAANATATANHAALVAAGGNPAAIALASQLIQTTARELRTVNGELQNAQTGNARVIADEPLVQAEEQQVQASLAAGGDFRTRIDAVRAQTNAGGLGELIHSINPAAPPVPLTPPLNPAFVRIPLYEVIDGINTHLVQENAPLARIDADLRLIQGHFATAQTASQAAQAMVGVVGAVTPGAPRLRRTPQNANIVQAMAGTLNIQLKVNDAIRNQLEIELEKLEDAVTRPTIPKMLALPLSSLAVVAQLVKDNAPPAPPKSADEQALINMAVATNPNTAAIVAQMNLHAGLPAAGAIWDPVFKALIPALKKNESTIKSLAGLTTAGVLPIQVSMQGTHPATSANIVGPMDVPILIAPVPAGVEAVLVKALTDNMATSNRLDLEILNLMVAGFIADHPGSLAADEADYAVRVAMSTLKWLSYCAETRTVGQILFERLHPQGYTATRHPMEETMARYREAAVIDRVALETVSPQIERYASYAPADTPMALPDNFATVMRGAVDGSLETQALADAYDTYMARRTPETYDVLVGLYRRTMGPTIASSAY